MRAGYIGKRILMMIPMLIGITIITFTISRIMPTDPARMAAGLNADQQTVEHIRHEFGLDEPLPVQYLLYIEDLARGDLGTSLITRQPVASEILRYFPATLELTLVTIFSYALIGIVLGTIAGMSDRPSVDTSVRLGALIAYALPPFWVGLVVQVVFFGHWGILPAEGRIDVPPPHHVTGLYLVDSIVTWNWSAFRSSAIHLVLPVATLVLSEVGLMVRLVRVSVLDIRNRQFVRTAIAKGLPPRTVTFRHVLRNALLPVTTMLGLQFGWLLGGTVVVETIFGWPGLGRYAVTSILNSDYNPVMAVALVGTLVFMVSNLVIDVIYSFLDPRITYS